MFLAHNPRLVIKKADGTSVDTTAVTQATLTVESRNPETGVNGVEQCKMMLRTEWKFGQNNYTFVVNLLSTELTVTEKTVLSKWLEFCP